MDSYKIVFKGELKPGSDREALILPLCKFLNIPASKGHLLFSGKSLALRKGLEHEKAIKIYNALDKLGLITHLICEEKITDEISSQRESKVSPDISKSVTPKTCPHCGKALSDLPQQEDVEPKQSENASLKVKPKWQPIFALFDRLNGRTQSYAQIVRNDAYKDLLIGQKLRISFSIWGFLFGPFYYFYHRLWAKSFFILSFCLITLSLINLMSGIIKPVVYNTISLLFTSIIFGQFAKYDYYRLKVNNEPFYPELPKWLGYPVTITTLFLLSLALVVITDPVFKHEREQFCSSTQRPSKDDTNSLISPTTAKADRVSNRALNFEPKAIGSISSTEKELSKHQFSSFEELNAYSKKHLGKREGAQLHEVN